MGANSAPRNPPRCKTMRFRGMGTDLFTNVRRPVLYDRNLVFCVFVKGTFPFKMFLAHSLKQVIRPLSLPRSTARAMGWGAWAK